MSEAIERSSDLPVHGLQSGVQVLLHLEERRSSGRLLYGVRQSHDPAVVSKPLFALEKLLKRGRKMNFKDFLYEIRARVTCWLRLPPPFSECGFPGCSHWSETRSASPLHTGLRPPDSEASCSQAV